MTRLLRLKLTQEPGPMCAGEDVSFTPALLSVAYLSVYGVCHGIISDVSLQLCNILANYVASWFVFLVLYVLPSKLKLFGESG